MASRRITRETIDAAQVEFLYRLRAWEDQVENDDDDCCGIRVEIARSVTLTIFKRLPGEWLVGLVVALSLDGILELVDVEGEEHNRAKVSAASLLDTYVGNQESGANALTAYLGLVGVYGNQTFKPDAVLEGFSYSSLGDRPRRLRERPLVVVEIQTNHLGVLEIIEEARLYLSEPHVQRVVVLKFFRAKAAALQLEPPLLLKLALALVFERSSNVQPGELVDVRVVDEVSFGTAPVADRVLEHLSTVPSRISPAGEVRLIAESPLEEFAIETSGVRARPRIKYAMYGTAKLLCNK